MTVTVTMAMNCDRDFDRGRDRDRGHDRDRDSDRDLDCKVPLHLSLDVVLGGQLMLPCKRLDLELEHLHPFSIQYGWRTCKRKVYIEIYACENVYM
jgi:hypothetical protein